MNESNNLHKFHFDTNTSKKSIRLNQKPLLLWFTGLSGSGKSTLSNAVENFLHKENFVTVSLDGDNIRSGLCSDLSFSFEDREENIRRISEVSKLLLDNGIIVCASFISPLRKDRDLVRSIIGTELFQEIYISTPLSVCEHRDVKGLYKKARKGDLKNFTGISSIYEPPTNPNIIIDTTSLSIQQSCREIIEYIIPKLR